MAKKKNVILTPEQEQAATSLGITNLNSQNDLNKIDKYIADQAKKKKAEQGKNQKNQPKAQPDPASRLQINQGAGKGGGKVTAWNEERSDSQPPPITQGSLSGKGGGRPAKVKDDQFERLGIKPGTDAKNLTKGQKLALTFDNIRNIATSGPQPGGGAGRDGSTLTPRVQALKSGSTFNKGLAVAQKQNPNQKFPQTLPSLGRVVSVKTNDKKAKPAAAPTPTPKRPTPAPTPAPTPTPGPAPAPGPELKPSTIAEPELQRGPSSIVRNKAPDIRARLSIAQQTGRTKLGTNQLRIGSKSAMSGARKMPIAGDQRRALAAGNRQAFLSRTRNESFRGDAGLRINLNREGLPTNVPSPAPTPTINLNATPTPAPTPAPTLPAPIAAPTIAPPTATPSMPAASPAAGLAVRPPTAAAKPTAVAAVPKPVAGKPVTAKPVAGKPVAAIPKPVVGKPVATPTPAKPAAGLATGAAKTSPTPVTNKKQQPRVTGLAAGVARR